MHKFIFTVNKLNVAFCECVLFYLIFQYHGSDWRILKINISFIQFMNMSFISTMSFGSCWPDVYCQQWLTHITFTEKHVYKYVVSTAITILNSSSIAHHAIECNLSYNDTGKLPLTTCISKSHHYLQQVPVSSGSCDQLLFLMVICLQYSGN